MARACKVVGGFLVAIGVTVAVSFVTLMARDDDYAKKELVVARNPTNDVYKLEFGFAQIRRGFHLVSVAGGVLLTLNGATLVLLGSVAGRAGRS
jgi:hypothetical protein